MRNQSRLAIRTFAPSAKAARRGSPHRGATSTPPAKQDSMADTQQASGWLRDVSSKLKIYFAVKIYV
jgi:hypothetical protein